MIRRSPLALLVLCASLLPGASALAHAAHAARPTGGIVLQPSDAQGNAIPGPGYFQVTAAAGATLQLNVLVGNAGRTSTPISLAPVDARSGVYGGVSYNLPQQRRRRVGSWITLSRTRVSAPPDRGTVVSLSLHVPKGTAAGQYVGGLTAFAPLSARVRPGTRPRRTAAFQVQLRRIVAVVVTVPGALRYSFAVKKIGPVRTPTGVYLVARIRNSGNGLLSGQGNLWLWRLGQRKPVIATHLTLGTTVPHTTVRYPIRWAGRPPPGQYRLRVALWWNGGKARRDAAFRVQ